MNLALGDLVATMALRALDSPFRHRHDRDSRAFSARPLTSASILYTHTQTPLFHVQVLLLTTAIIASSIRFCSSTVLLLLLFEPVTVAKFNPSTVIHTMRHTQQRRLSVCGCEQELLLLVSRDTARALCKI